MSLLWQTLQRHANERGYQPALTDNHEHVTYRELLPLVRQHADLLRQTGADTVALAMDNSVAWVLWDLAALYAEIALVPIPPFFTPEQARHAMAEAGAKVLITAGSIDPLPHPQQRELPAGTAKVTFTSGTTGNPKGVCLSQAGMEQVAESILAVLGGNISARHTTVLPLAVLLENVAGVYTALLGGSTINLPSCQLTTAAPEVLCHTLQTTQAQSAILVPELLRGVVHHCQHRQVDLSALKFVAVGGAKVAPDLIFEARALGLPVYEGYGLSECGSVVALNTPQHDAIGTVGQLLPHIQARVHKDELVIQNPALLGYTSTPPHTGPFTTGDLGCFDEAGFLHINGRSKNVLITSYGRNVNPEWVESLLLAQPVIGQAIVYSDGSAHLSALLVPAHPDVRDEDLQQAVNQTNSQLPAYAQVSNWQTVAPFTPENGLLTGNGRPRRHDILALFA